MIFFGYFYIIRVIYKLLEANMLEYDIWIWVGVICVSLLVEFISMDMTSIWFSVGGFGALILSAFPIEFEYQIIVFIVLSGILLLTLRKWAKNKLLTSSDGKTNLDLLKQEKLELTSAITEHQKGTLTYGGVVWNAVSENGKPIDAGTFVYVVKIEGNKLIVKKEGE